MNYPKVLIVDDNKNYVSRLVSLFDDEGIDYPVFVAGNYDEAVQLIPKEKPELIFLDMNMPGKSGLEVLYYIKESGWKCKVVMVTNHANESYRKICMDAGADMFFDKSNDFGLIPGIIKKMAS